MIVTTGLPTQRELILKRLLVHFSLAQIEALADECDLGQRETGFFRVVVEFQNAHPRFIRREVSREMPK